MTILIMTSTLFEDSELLEPLRQLRAIGVKVDIAAPEQKPIIGKHGHKVEVDLPLAAVRPDDYDLLLLPGGRAPSELRRNVAALAIAHHFLQFDKPVAAICHGPQVLLATGLMKGRKATCHSSLKREMEAAGVIYRDSKVVVDGNLITSRQPSDMRAFMQAIFRVVRMQPSSRATTREGRSAGVIDPSFDAIDEAELESFPASDPPSWIAVRVGAPMRGTLARSNQSEPPARQQSRRP